MRPDVRAFLGFLGKLPGPRTHEMDAPTTRQMYVADVPAGGPAVVRDLSSRGRCR